MALSRRDFLKLTGASALALGGVATEAGAAPKMPARPFGKTGWKASIYALGSAEIPANEEAIRAIDRLIDAGVNYLDTAPSYQGSRSERAIGEVMKRRRPEVFLATKTLARDADGAYAEVKASLERLQCKRIDTLQIHAVNDFGTLDQVLGDKGAIKGLERARSDGLIRFIGITGHTRPEVIAKALDSYPFDSILVPVSALDKHLSDFAEEVVPKARKLGIGIVGMKSLKGLELSKGTVDDAEPLLRYALSLPISTLTIGLRKESEVEANLRSVVNFRPMSEAERKDLEERMKPFATTQALWWKRR
ncbi:MAG: aldo/keto reductase [Fimbriimonadaceae bacterium]|nr:aldo/keto reductase [Fimbriimonadaceae bacterium]